MPYQGRSERHAAVATKAVLHGDPTIEDNFAGVAAKNMQLGRFVDPSAAGNPAQTVAIGEAFVIMMGGMQEVRGAKIVGGIAAAPVGTKLFIVVATNLVTPTSNSGANPLFGIVDQVLTARDTVRVNTDRRDSI